MCFCRGCVSLKLSETSIESRHFIIVRCVGKSYLIEQFLTGDLQREHKVTLSKKFSHNYNYEGRSIILSMKLWLSAQGIF